VNRSIIPFICLLFLTTLPLAAQQTIIKIATLAPEGSTWITVMKDFDQAVRRESGNRIGFRIYAGGVQGDEKDYIRKIKLGQLQAAGVTGNGLTTVSPSLRLLDSPFLFRSYEEADYIHQQFDREFNSAFEQNGFVNLGWTEVGFVYVMTMDPVRSPEDMKNVKMWMWEGDPIAEAAFTALDIHPIPLSITDVMTSLQTRMINGVYTSPYAAVALQWFSRVKNMLDVPLADASGSVVISKKTFDALPRDLQEILLRNGQKYMRHLTDLNRQDNEKAILTLRKNGISINEPPSPQALASYEEIGRKARASMAGKIFSKELLARVEAAVAEFRKTHTVKTKSK
jgi:TRAP-type transport system periplasmic protein